MLKALELVGFKSFADKTRFEFPEGITVVVGPNGSGKSNIVDGIKWVLGEQSVKSLRGKEMADVIYKGGGGGRKPMNTAEATIIIDNSDGRIAIDAPEVHVTRRVYRSGEGEYLINREPCRLKDIRDMFRGTGVGADAYSIIEQGKVDRLLQASAKERRAIFEEAAGISRFKAKKVEAGRRLERVEQNLLRLSDIVDEVESRLKTVRSQASRAKRYREYSDRLQELRTAAGMTDYREMSEKLSAIQSRLDGRRQQAEEAAAEAEELETQAAELETEAVTLAESARTSEARFSRVLESLAGHQTNIDNLNNRRRELEAEQQRDYQRLSATRRRTTETSRRIATTMGELEAAEASHAAILSSVDYHETALQEIATKLDKLRDANLDRRNQYMQEMRTAAGLSNDLSTAQTQLSAATSAATRLQGQLEEASARCTAVAAQIEGLKQQQQRLQEEFEAKSAALEIARAKLSEARRNQAEKQAELSELKNRQSGATQRADLLEELERRFEGLSAGVREVLARSRQEQEGPFCEVRGLVADLLQVNVDDAPLIDLALGERAQSVVLAGDALIQMIQTGEYRTAGRVGFLLMNEAGEEPAGPDLTGQPGVVNRADRLVQTSAGYEALMRRLLGDTWFVEDLTTALQLLKTVRAPVRLVTRTGQVVESSYSIITGPRERNLGIISRRSELRALLQESKQLEARIAELQTIVTQLTGEIAQQDVEIVETGASQQEAERELSAVTTQLASLQDNLDQLQTQRTATETDLEAAGRRSKEFQEVIARVEKELAKVEGSARQSEAHIRETERTIEELDAKHQVHIHDVTSAKVEFARSDQQLMTHRAQLSSLREDQAERARALQQTREQIQQAARRCTEANRTILRCTSETARLYILKDDLAATTQDLIQQQQETGGQRTELHAAANKLRQQQRKLEDALHRDEMEAGEVRLERSTLAQRLMDDYGIDIASLETQDAEMEEERREVEEEIASLRRKIANVGAVNMDALEELDELQSRYDLLAGQYKDLVDAKESLQRIINRINADSRRLFAETLEAIRANFQVLYRKSFGGGKADIILEEGVDILEAGIEIVATPPGKPQFNNSLLSGGEKALTAVSLLMAIFQFRPSPFCVLDEVDAPFDEANVGRFIGVLTEFLEWTRFVIVTHSKKTMTAANTLYGVTMQESGVSKRVSVQFDDVSEDGSISQAAVEREEGDAA